MSLGNSMVNALVPMKGHSERVPNKNLRLLCGKPLCLWVLEALSKSDFIDNIIVDTDSPEITDVVKKSNLGITVIDRPSQIRGDFVTMNTIIAHDMSCTEGEYFLQTHSTNPLLTTSTINSAVGSYFNNLREYDSLFSVTRHQTRFYLHDGQPINHKPHEMLRTQDLHPVYEENSNIYIFSRKSFLSANNRRIGNKPQMFEMSSLEAVDIDEEEDFGLAEMLMRDRIS